MDEIVQPKEPSSFILILALAIAGLFAGIVLSGVYTITLPAIRKNQAEEIKKAIFNVLPGVARYDILLVKGNKTEPYNGPEGSVPQEPAVYKGFAKDGKQIGYAILGDGPGFQDIIKLMYGYDPSKKLIIGMKVLENRETPGLGDKIVKDNVFLSNFKKLSVDPPVEPHKRGTKQPNQIDTITGATISSVAIIKILNQSHGRFIKLELID